MGVNEVYQILRRVRVRGLKKVSRDIFCFREYMKSYMIFLH